MKKTYKTIYSYQVIDRMKTNPKIYLLDREERDVISVAEMPTGDLVSVFAIAEKETTRFEFWEEIEEQET